MLRSGCRSFAGHVGSSNTTHPSARASLSSNDRNPWSRLLYQAIAKILVLVRRLWAGLVVDELPGGNHRRGRAGATPGGGAYGAYRCATNGGGGWGPGHTGNVGAAHTSRPFASERFSPRAPAPAAPPLPAQYAIRRDKPDESALSLSPFETSCQSCPATIGLRQRKQEASG